MDPGLVSLSRAFKRLYPTYRGGLYLRKGTTTQHLETGKQNFRFVLSDKYKEASVLCVNNNGI